MSHPPSSSSARASEPGPIRVVSVNLGRVRALSISGRTIGSAIGKRAAEGAVAVEALGLAGDEQADPTVHGGLDKAVYAYPAEHYGFWRNARHAAGASGGLIDDALPPGALGENLTLEGLLEHQVWMGDRLVLPDCELVVSEPRQPCYKFVAVMGFATAAKAMAQASNCGFYLRVVRPGQVRAGQAVRLEPGPRQVRIDEAFRRKMSRRDV